RHADREDERQARASVGLHEFELRQVIAADLQARNADAQQQLHVRFVLRRREKDDAEPVAERLDLVPVGLVELAQLECLVERIVLRAELVGLERAELDRVAAGLFRRHAHRQRAASRAVVVDADLADDERLVAVADLSAGYLNLARDHATSQPVINASAYGTPTLAPRTSAMFRIPASERGCGAS